MASFFAMFNHYNFIQPAFDVVIAINVFSVVSTLFVRVFMCHAGPTSRPVFLHDAELDIVQQHTRQNQMSNDTLNNIIKVSFISLNTLQYGGQNQFSVPTNGSISESGAKYPNAYEGGN